MADPDRDLRELADLRASGALDGEEYSRAAARLLGEARPTPRDGPGPAGRLASAPADNGVWPSARGGRVPPGHTPAAVVGASGLLVIVAFTALPAVRLPLLGPSSGAQLAVMTAEQPLLAVLWLVPILAAVVSALAAVQLWQNPTQEGAPAPRVLSAILSTLILAVYGAAFVAVRTGTVGPPFDPAVVLDVGFWAGMGAAVIAVVSGALASRPALLAATGVVVVAGVAVGALSVLPPAAEPVGQAGTAPAAAYPIPAPGAGTQVPPTLPPSAQESLDRATATGRAAAEGLIGSWVPQLSAKRVGLEADGIVYGAEDILEHFATLAGRYPGALLLRTDDYPSYRIGGFFVVVVPLPFSSAEGALDWCASEGRGRDDCLAKRLMLTGGYEGTVRYQP